MQTDIAKQAGALAAAIDGLTQVIAGLQAAKTRGVVLAGKAQGREADGAPSDLVFPTMTAAESATMLDDAIAIYQARLDAAEQALAAL